MKYISVASGIEAATVAWHPLGWVPAAFSEIEPFPCALLAHYYPHVPNLGNMERYREWPAATPDVLVAGTPCQSFSVAGLRAGLADPRGNLALVYLAIAGRYRPSWVVWENVPGLMSSDDGRALGAFLGGLAELGYGFAYRVFDAQYFGLAQRRKRVFVVGYLGDWRRAAAVLFDSASLRGDPAPSREARQGIAGAIRSRSGGGCGPTADEAAAGQLIAKALAATDGGIDREDRHTLVAGSVSSKWAKGTGGPAGDECYNLIAAFSCKDAGQDAGDLAPTLRSLAELEGNANGGGQIAVAFDTTQITCPDNYSAPQPGDPCHPLAAEGRPPVVAFADVADPVAANQADTYTREGKQFRMSNVAIAFKPSHYTRDKDSGPSEIMAPLTADADKGDQDPVIFTGTMVRRLTPRECERLQGFPDDYTLISYRGKPAKDAPRYRALGNSMAVPVMRWIGQRIQLVEELDARAA